MDETLSTITKQRLEGEGTTLRLGTTEFYRSDSEDHRWCEQPSGKPVGIELQQLLEDLEPHAHELAPVVPKPVDVDDLYDQLLEHFQAEDAAYAEETGGLLPTPEFRYRIVDTEVALAVLGRDDSVAVAAVREALERPYLNYGTLRSVYDGPLECC